MNVAVVGVGYWGPNLVRNFFNHSAVDKLYCFDVNKDQTKKICERYPGVECVDSYNEILRNENISGVVLATPVATHFPLARQALEHNKNVFVEKPLTSNTAEAQMLVELARKKSLVLMVDHIFVYNGAVRKIKELIDVGEVGEIMYFDAVRINLGLFQKDVNVLWDLAPHDLSIMDYLLKEKPRAVAAVGQSHYTELEDIVYLTLFFDNHCIAHIHVSWLAPIKVRRVIIGGTKKMILLDDGEPVEKIRIYDKGIETTAKEGASETLIQYRSGGVSSPKYDTTEPLARVVDEFIRAIEKKADPLSDGVAGLNIVKILEAAEESIRGKGKIIELYG